MLTKQLRFKFSTAWLENDPVLKNNKIQSRNIFRNLPASKLYEFAIKGTPGNPTTQECTISSTGALVSYSGKYTGRKPQDKRMVCDDYTRDKIWWGDVNIPISNDSYKVLESSAINYLNNKIRVFVVDGYIGWDINHRIRCRILCTRAYHALFMRNMMVIPTEEELQKDFNEGVDYHIFNAGEFQAPVHPFLEKEGVPNSGVCTAVNLSSKRITILGSQYAGEMKKGLFGVMHYEMPKKGFLSLHSSCTEGLIEKDVSLLFGLSGTGKTTLSADPKRSLIGDDEHVWTDQGIFNIEGGCYAKAIGLSRQLEPEIYDAIKYGSVLENVRFHPNSDVVNYHDISVTENTRVSYPLEFIPGAKIPAVGGHPKNIFFLTCDAFGVLPPISKLTSEQAMYHFISGYTAKVAGTEMGIKEPQPTFSACFGEAFLPLHPTIYAELLAKKMKEHGTKAWLINTGWTGGKYGDGKRISLQYTRKIIEEVHLGNLDNVQFTQSDIFGLHVPTSVNGIPSSILNPENSWSDKNHFQNTLKSLAQKFQVNFDKYKSQANQNIIFGGPTL